MVQKEVKGIIGKQADCCFEVSWEVCNKVGGIYTVLSSKAASMKAHYGEGYFAVGPYFAKKIGGEFKEKIPPEDLNNVFMRLKSDGIICHYGTWLVQSEPDAILLDISTFASHKDEIKTKLWNDYQIDSLNTQYFDYDEPVIWSYAAGKFIEAYAAEHKGKKVVGHFHEWLAGPGLLYLHSQKAKVATVFTTHATTLGRSLSGSNIDIYNDIERINADEQARRLGVHTKHQTESAAANAADVFSTVSDITGLEAKNFLHKSPDIILPNGLDMDKFPTFEEASVRHRQLKRKIKEFVRYHFFPYYVFDLEQTLYYFLFGRYEFRNKGIDVFIASLGRLNETLKKEKSKRTIVAFVWVPANVRSIKRDLIENKTQYEGIRESIVDDMEAVKDRLITGLIAQNKVCDVDLLTEATSLDIKKRF